MEVEIRYVPASEFHLGGIDYRLGNGREGRITDANILRTFYDRILKTKQKTKARPRAAAQTG